MTKSSQAEIVSLWERYKAKVGSVCFAGETAIPHPDRWGHLFDGEAAVRTMKDHVNRE